MAVFFTLFIKLIPLYLIIALGFVGAKKLGAQKETIARLLIYIITPVIVFYGAYTVDITPENLSLPFIFYVLASFSSLIFLMIGNYVFRADSTKNILAFSAGVGNTGYFWLPVVSAVLWDKAFSVAVIAMLGFIVYENSLGFFIAAKGNHSTKESLFRVIKLPSLYTFFIGLLLNFFKFPAFEIISTTATHFKWAYTILGMMMVGMGLASTNIRQFDYKFTWLAFLAKFIFWPSIVLCIITLDRYYMHFYTPLIYNIFLIMAIVPMAANTVSIATELKIHPEKASLAVFASTIFGLFYIPIIISLFISY
ncbi:MAG: hypothetical protein ACD_78C00422G0007 [uncultured bacterium (gcode 4)]|uniref:Transporter n=1 Tax=uncultured bacterium (gcode 4) TaxID=1234023 RepID=K1YVU4_9BACT|nr:MAG: hypothetical protein ACD_78C00422G0007 [uncultured bacterium (gcode 4)]